MQKNYFESIDQGLSQIQDSLGQLTTINASIACLTDIFDSAFGPYVDGPLSNSPKFIYTSLGDLNSSKIIPFFVKFLEWVHQNTELGIPPVNHSEMCDKKLLVNKIDNDWDQLEPPPQRSSNRYGTEKD